jgi:hypothetical protein
LARVAIIRPLLGNVGSFSPTAFASAQVTLQSPLGCTPDTTC